MGALLLAPLGMGSLTYFAMTERVMGLPGRFGYPVNCRGGGSPCPPEFMELWCPHAPDGFDVEETTEQTGCPVGPEAVAGTASRTAGQAAVARPGVFFTPRVINIWWAAMVEWRDQAGHRADFGNERRQGYAWALEVGDGPG